MDKDVKAFLKVKREKGRYRPVYERVKDYKDVVLLRSHEQSKEQASRCMDCGTPFCHWGCPVGNYIPEWNDAVLAGHWEKAFQYLNAANNLPEITGRICPAICEYACVLGINDDAVTVRENELAIIEYGFKHGFIKANPPKKRSGKKIAVVGSGPAGLACGDQLNKAGHNVTVFEKDEKIGGIMRYGIPDFKLEKHLLDRRLNIWKKEGIEFKTNSPVTPGVLKSFDAMCIATGSSIPRDLKIEGRSLEGIHFAMDYLIQNNRRISGQEIFQSELIDTKGKKVVVIGGGDTGSDCVGTANRQGAKCVVQIEVMSKPDLCRSEDYPWPMYPLLLKTSTSHQEGTLRQWAILTKKFIGENGKVKKLLCVKVEFIDKEGESCLIMREIPNTEFEIEADLVILAVGFLHPQHSGLIKDLGLELDNRGNIKASESYMTSCEKIFTAGDAHRGQSLIVHAISEGRGAAHHIDEFLMGESNLPVL